MTIQFNLTFMREPLDINSTNWQETCYHWRAHINNQDFDFYTGAGWVTKAGTPKRPKLDDVLHSLVSDSDACELSFNEWCENIGYDNDSRQALATYLLCQENTHKLIKAGINLAEQRERLQDY